MADAILNLLDIMRDESASPRDRINAAVSASRVEKLQLPGDEPPESIAYLRSLLDDQDVPTNFRREAAAACAYFERRSAKAALTFEVADTSEQRKQWAVIAKAALRARLSTTSAWPDHRHLLRSTEQIHQPPTSSPELAIAAMLTAAHSQASQRKRRAIDDPGGPTINSERERRLAIRALAGTIQPQR
jgi:hypothetical protein